MPGYRHRNMYYLTGLPGWVRFGYSPGWVGRSPTGLGPAAQYLMTGQWPTPQMAAYWQQMRGGTVPPPQTTPYGAGWGAVPMGAPAGMTPEQEVQMLKNQSQMLSQQLEQINSRIAELEKQKQSK